MLQQPAKFLLALDLATTTGNRMTTDGVWTYTYDDVGNVTSRSKGTGTITWDYTYDHNNQMLTASYQAFTWAGVACQ